MLVYYGLGLSLLAVSGIATWIEALQHSPLQVTMNLKEQSWLRVVIDGKTEFEGLLPARRRLTWTARKKLSVRASNAGAVMVSIKGKEGKPLGKPGEVEEAIFSAE